MTYHKLVTLRCDCDGCNGCGQQDEPVGCLAMYEGDEWTATEARERAKEREGWKYRSGEDYCDDCAPHN